MAGRGFREMAEQRPGAPKEEWVPRADIVSRKVIERMDALAKSVVTWERLVLILGAAAVAIVGAAWVVTMMASTSAAAAARNAGEEVTATRTQMAEDVRQVRSDVTGRVQLIEAKVDAVYGLLIERRSRAEVRAEVKRRTNQEE